MGASNNRFRDYDPLTGRYLQPDPIGHDGGVNLYGYPVNPLVDVDLRGLIHRKGKGAANNAPAPTTKAARNGKVQTTKGPKLMGVSDATVALAARPGTSKAHIKARKLVAKRFYKQHGKIWDPNLNGGAGGKRHPTASEARAQLNGIDYTKPVTTGPPPLTPSLLSQWQRPGGRQGQFYADPGTKPQKLGIHDTADGKGGRQVPKVPKNYNMNSDDGPYLKSTAGPIKDTWSRKGHSHYAEGGATQYYVPNDTTAT